MRVPVAALFSLAALAATAAADTMPPRPRPDNARFAYPEPARLVSVTGEVRFSADVDARGKVTAVKLLAVPRPHLGFEETVEQVVRKWRFDPATLDGKPVSSTYQGGVVFRLHPEDEKQIAVATARLAAAWNARAADRVLAEIDASPSPDPAAGDARPADELRAWLAGELGEQAPGLQPAPRVVWFRTPTVALAEIAREGIARPVSAVLVKREAGWRVLKLEAGGYVVGGDVQEPRKIKNVFPVYPEVAKQARVQGVVLLEAQVNEEGRVTDLRLLRGIPMLNGPAVDAVKQWRYTPTLVEGKPVPVLMTVIVNFLLR